MPLFYSSTFIDMSKHMMPASFMPHLYQDLPPIGNKLANRSSDGNASIHPGHSSADLNISTSMIPSFGSKLGLLLPDPAPDVAPNPDKLLSAATNTQLGVTQTSTQFKRISTSIKYQITCRCPQEYTVCGAEQVHTKCIHCSLLLLLFLFLW